MRPYKQLGDVPRKRHMRFSDDGQLAYEELFGREGFSGPSSLLYHRGMPEGAQDVSEGPADLMTPEHEQVHTNAHLKGFDLPSQGDVITGQALAARQRRRAHRARRAGHPAAGALRQRLG